MLSSANVLSGPGPRYRTGPLRIGTRGPEAVDLAGLAGLDLDAWQQVELDHTLGTRADGRWAARESGLIVPRQNGKGSILEAIELLLLYMGERGPDGKPLTLIHSAHEFKTSLEAYLRIRSLIESTSLLMREVKTFANAHGAEGVELKNGNRLKFVARTKGSGRGFSGDLVVLDEAYNLSALGVGALGPTMSARHNPLLIYTSSAPADDAASAVLRTLCRRGRAGDPRLTYSEYCAYTDRLRDERGLEIMGPDRERILTELTADPSQLVAANPGYPHRINDDAVETERGMMTLDIFARERFGVWIDDDALDTPAVIPPADWNRSGNPAATLVGTPGLALAVAEDRSRGAFGAAGASSAGGLHLETVDYRPGTDWIVERAAELVNRWGGPLVIAKGSPAASLVKDLDAAGVELLEVSVEWQARACGQVFDAITTPGGCTHRDETPLNVSVRGAAKRGHGDAWVWAMRRSTVDISPLVAVTLAAGVYGGREPVDLLGQIL